MNDEMGVYVANQMMDFLAQKGLKNKNSKILILGVTFKENCPDFRNTKVVDTIKVLKDNGLNVDIHDPLVDKKSFKNEYGLSLISELNNKYYDGIILAVAHNNYREINIKNLKKHSNSVVYDLKGFLDKESLINRL